MIKKTQLRFVATYCIAHWKRGTKIVVGTIFADSYAIDCQRCRYLYSWYAWRSTITERVNDSQSCKNSTFSPSLRVRNNINFLLLGRQ